MRLVYEYIQPLQWITLAAEDPEIQIKVEIKKQFFFYFYFIP